MNTANIMYKIHTTKKFVHILTMFIINKQKENMNKDTPFLKRSYESSHFLCLCILTAMFRMPEEPVGQIWNTTAQNLSFPTACIISPKYIRMWASFRIFAALQTFYYRCCTISTSSTFSLPQWPSLPWWYMWHCTS